MVYRSFSGRFFLILCGLAGGAALAAVLSACAPAVSGQIAATQPPPQHVEVELPTRTPAPTLTPLPAAATESTPLASPTVTGTPEPAYPAEHYIRTITGHRQYFSLGCEASVAVDWAGYFGVNINEFNFQIELPLSDNPEKGFVGDVNAPWGQVPPYGYGVYAGPVADLLVKYGLPARAVKGWTIEQVKEELAQNRPVIAWVIGNVEGGVPAEYTDKEGSKVIVAAYEHTIILTGYNAKNIRYMTNGRFIDVPTDVFENSWSVLGKMAIYSEAP
jgi:uncharacterized protein YvpB